MTGTREYKLWAAARFRARIKGWAFSIFPSDVKIPRRCPVLGILLRRGKGVLRDSSPTLDRFDSRKGYVIGNVFVISYKANRIKCDATVEELKKVLRYAKEGL